MKPFLSDKRIIKMPSILWQPILHGFILTTRPKQSAALYEMIFEDGVSPLLKYARAQAANVRRLLPHTKVGIAMSYSSPLIPEAIEEMLQAGVNDLTIIPLYPQYSGTTVGSVFDDVMAFFRRSDKIIDLRFISSFYDHPKYIDYYAEKNAQAVKEHAVDTLNFSYHGIPASYVTDGDRYPDECTETTRLIMEKLAVEIPHLQTYQSKFGPNEWLTPATDATMKALPEQKSKKILVIAPGFVADCLETIEELTQENKGYFLEAGGTDFYYLPPFNDDQALAEIFVDLLNK
ncbi:ferrochelatase [Candidatus Enterococcus testudinis]|nr:ferrochelatase [Enterococcus sp. 8G7_MSG3316]